MLSILILFSCFLMVAYVLLLLYYRKSWNQIPDFHFPGNTASKTFISIIVAARNEEENIVNLITAIRNQNYPSHLYELIVVDDHSTDKTLELAKSFESHQIKIISLQTNRENTIAFKKAAIELGIQYSKGELIITTDADCIMPSTWLGSIAAFYEQHHPKMIVMPVLIKNDRSFLGIFQTLDFMSLQGITGAAVFKKMHGMCNGANLAYTKDVFNEVNGFENINHIASGDDMLLMQKIAKLYKSGILYLKSPNVIVETAAEKKLKSFIHQRIRWASKADKYEDKTLFPVLLLVYMINLLLLVMFICGFVFNFEFSILNFYFLFFFLLSIKLVAELYFLIPVSRFFGYTKLLWLFPLFQPFHIIYTVVAGWMGKFGSYRWKGRELSGLSPRPLSKREGRNRIS